MGLQQQLIVFIMSLPLGLHPSPLGGFVLLHLGLCPSPLGPLAYIWPVSGFSLVATNIYLRKTLEKPKTGLWTLRVKGPGVVFMHGEGICTPHVRHQGRQPLIKCAKSWLCFILFPFFYVFYLLGSTKARLLLLHILNCDEELRPM